MTEYYEPAADDLLLLVVPYSPQQAVEIKAQGTISTEARQKFLAGIKQDAFEIFYATVEATALKHGLMSGESSTGHSCLVGDKAKIAAAFEDISPFYNSRIFTVDEYSMFEEHNAQVRALEAQGLGADIYVERVN